MDVVHDLSNTMDMDMVFAPRLHIPSWSNSDITGGCRTSDTGAADHWNRSHGVELLPVANDHDGKGIEDVPRNNWNVPNIHTHTASLGQSNRTEVSAGSAPSVSSMVL